MASGVRSHRGLSSCLWVQSRGWYPKTKRQASACATSRERTVSNLSLQQKPLQTDVSINHLCRIQHTPGDSKQHKSVWRVVLWHDAWPDVPHPELMRFVRLEPSVDAATDAASEPTKSEEIASMSGYRGKASEDLPSSIRSLLPIYPRPTRRTRGVATDQPEHAPRKHVASTAHIRRVPAYLTGQRGLVGEIGSA